MEDILARILSSTVTCEPLLLVAVHAVQFERLTVEGIKSKFFHFPRVYESLLNHFIQDNVPEWLMGMTRI